MIRMKEKISELRTGMNKLVEKKEEQQKILKEEIYSLSTQLDQLIVQYYRENKVL